MIPDPLAAVIFDMDGLLLDTEAIYKMAIRDACGDLGHVMVEALHISLIGLPREINDQRLRDAFGPSFDPVAFHHLCEQRFEGLCAGGVPLRPGALALLQWLAEAGVPRAVATSNLHRVAHDHLTRAGAMPYLDAVITRDQVTLGKPHPETFLAAAAVGADPRRCLALEDSHNGARAAAAAGMATIMIPDELPYTDEIRALGVHTLPDLGAVLAALQARGRA